MQASLETIIWMKQTIFMGMFIYKYRIRMEKMIQRIQN